MEFTTSYCPNPHCTHYGKRGFGVHLVLRGADHGIPRLLCTRCEGTFSARQGTAYSGVRAAEPSQRPPAKPEACKRWNRSKRFGCEPPTGGPSYHRSI